MLHALRHFVTENLGIKIASLILALAIYAHVLSSEDRETVFTLPLQVVGVPEGLTYAGNVPDRIQVRIQGKGTELWKLRTQPLYAEIDLGEARPGLLQRPVSTADVVLPPGSDAQVKAIVRSVVLALQVEPLVTRALPVAPLLEGQLDSGMIQVGRTVVAPATLRVSGPQRRVESLDSLRTEGIALSGRSHPLEVWARVTCPEGVTLQGDSVRVSIPIEAWIRQALGPVPVLLPRSLVASWVADPDSVQVMLEGPESQMENVHSSDVTARAIPRPSSAGGTQFGVPVQPTVSPKHPGLKAVGTVPDTVTIRRRTGGSKNSSG